MILVVKSQLNLTWLVRKSCITYLLIYVTRLNLTFSVLNSIDFKKCITPST